MRQFTLVLRIDLITGLFKIVVPSVGPPLQTLVKYQPVL
jgi:hypothetical protein